MLAVLLLAAGAAAPPLTYELAKAMADRNEASLSAPLTSQLLEAQAAALAAAMGQCLGPSPDLAKFTVVLRLNADGSVAESWRQGDTALAKCVHSSLSTSGLAGQWPQPFYTSFRVTLSGA